jgi:2-haloalkanoic acid dehalogenase type II
MTTAKRAVYFDLGGTLFSNIGIPKVNAPVFKEAAERLGKEGDMGTLGMAYVNAAREAHQDYADRKYYLHRELFYDSYTRFLAALEVEEPADFADWFYEAQRSAMVNGLRVRSDCLATLAALRERGFGLSVVSNIDDDYLVPMMKKFGLEPYFDHWSSSEEAQACKPHPRFFEYALEKAGHRAEEVIFVGDSRHHDIQGAHRVGMMAVLIEENWGKSHLDEGDANPDHTIGKLAELLELAELKGA